MYSLGFFGRIKSPSGGAFAWGLEGWWKAGGSKAGASQSAAQCLVVRWLHMYLARSRSVPGGMSVLLVPRLRLCVPRDYPSHTTRRRPVRYIWLHMATCVMGPKDGDADFQQR